jgi:hypothetical protein
MIKVTITNHVIEQSLTTGYKLKYDTEVIEGIPAMSKLFDCRMDNGCVVLSFTDPIPGPDRDLCITVQRTQP